MAPIQILIVDDELSIRRVLKAHLNRSGYTVVCSENGQLAIDTLKSTHIDLVITDINMPVMDGRALLEHVQSHYPDIPVVMITAHGTVDLAVEAMRAGAYTFINKPFDKADLLVQVRSALADRIPRQLKFHGSKGQFSIIGQTESMRSVFSLIERVADSMATVLIEGESGTGKELVARALHEYSIRSEGPFIQVNCGAIPENLFESELFGHEKGAFTGAIQSKPGRFELAHNGTLFLDEIGELPKDLQVKLLRALQDGQYDRVGGSVTRHAHIRLVAATNRVLADEVAEGRFREDLYYRLNVIPIQLPPLRQRMADIPLLSNHFAEQAAKKFGLTHRPLSPQSQALLSQHDWPGNIRELENIIERAVLLVDPNTDTLELNNLVGFKQSIPDQIDPLPDKQVNLKDFIRQETARIESSHIRNALEQCDGNVTHTARLLGISRKSLQNKMRSYGLRDNADDTEDRVEE